VLLPHTSQERHQIDSRTSPGGGDDLLKLVPGSDGVDIQGLGDPLRERLQRHAHIATERRVECAQRVPAVPTWAEGDSSSPGRAPIGKPTTTDRLPLPHAPPGGHRVGQRRPQFRCCTQGRQAS